MNSTPLTDEFENRYARWLTHIRESPDCAFASNDQPFIDNAPYRAIVAIGAKVIPLIINRMAEDPDGHFLHHALAELSGHTFTPADFAKAQQRGGKPIGDQAICALWADWWESRSDWS